METHSSTIHLMKAAQEMIQIIEYQSGIIEDLTTRIEALENA